MHFLATIAEGEADTADLAFLFAVICAIIAAIFYVCKPPLARFAPVLLCVSVALGWLGLLLL